MSVNLKTWPTSRQDAFEDLYSALMNPKHPDGVYLGNASECLPYADSTGMQIKVQIGQMLVRGFEALIEVEQTLAVSAAHASLPRIDRLVARLDRSATPYTISLTVLTGTAASSPVPPALVDDADTFDMELAQIAVGAAVGTIAANKVTVLRKWTGVSPIQTWSSTWAIVGGSTMSLATISDAANLAEYQVDNGKVWFNVNQLIQLNGTSGPAILACSLPVGVASISGVAATAQNRPPEVSTVPSPTNQVWFQGGDYANSQNWQVGSPFWFRATGMYRIASS